MRTFEEVYNETKHLQLSADFQLKYIWDHAQRVKDLPGEAAECGCYQGGSSQVIYKALDNKKTLHIFDTFSGLPSNKFNDHPLPDGSFSCSLDQVQTNLADCPLIIYHPGLVPDTLQEVADLKFCFVYLDMDLYQPTLEALRFFYPRMTKGAVIVLDDYPGFNSIVRATHEFCDEVKIEFKLLPPYNVMIPKKWSLP